MRSDLVHSANQRLNNRFLLCRMTSAAARCIRGPHEAFPISINQALKHIAKLSANAPEPSDGALETATVQTKLEQT